MKACILTISLTFVLYSFRKCLIKDSCSSTDKESNGGKSPFCSFSADEPMPMVDAKQVCQSKTVSKKLLIQLLHGIRSNHNMCCMQSLTGQAAQRNWCEDSIVYDVDVVVRSCIIIGIFYDVLATSVY